MARIARKNLDAMYYHVMVQGINKEYIFEKDECKKIYIKLLKKYSSECDISLVAYCIMGNHAHLLLKIKNILDLSKCMKKINTTFAIYDNELLNRVGFVFRDRFKSETIYDKYYLHNCIKYIHNNPIKANILKDVGNYKYSSYHLYKNKLLEKELYEEIFNNEDEYYDIINSKNSNECNFIDEPYTIAETKEWIENYVHLVGYPSLESIVGNDVALSNLVINMKNECGIKNKEISQILHIDKSKLSRLLKK